MPIEVGSAYVSLLPSLKGFGARLASGTATAASTAGSAASTKFSEKFSQSAGEQVDKQLPKELQGAGDKAGAELAEGTAQTFGQRFKERFGLQIKLAASFAGLAAAAYTKSAITAASEAEQAQGAAAAVFKKSFKQISDASKTAASDVGLASAEYLQLTTLLGTQLKNKGIKDFAGESQKLVTLGSDLSSMYGGDVKEAVEAIGSALRGETDPIERYGISMNEAALKAEALAKGIVKPVQDAGKVAAATQKVELAQRAYTDAVKKHGKNSDEAKRKELALTSAQNAFTKATEGKVEEMTLEQKAQAAMSLLMQQSADATGNWAREQETYAHKVQVLKAQLSDFKELLGAQLLPYASKFAGFMSTKFMPVLTDATKVLFTGQSDGGIAKILGPEAAGRFMEVAAQIRGVFVELSKSVEDIDWAAIGAILADAFAGIAEAIQNSLGQIDMKSVTKNFGEGVQSMGWFGDVVKSVFGWLIEHQDGIAKAAPMIIGVATAMHLLNKAFSPDSLLGFGLRMTMTLVQTIVNYKLAKSMEKVYEAQVKQTAAEAGGFVAKVKNVGATTAATVKNWAHVASEKARAFFTRQSTVETNKGTLATLRQRTATLLSTAATKAQMLATKIATGVQKAFNLVMKMNPIGLVIIAITALVGALVWLYRNNETARRIMDACWNAIKTTITTVWTVHIKPTLDRFVGFVRDKLIPVVVALWKIYVKPTFDRIGGHIKSIWAHWIKPAFDAIVKAIGRMPAAFSKAKDGITTAWDKIRRAALKPVEFVVQSVLNFGLIEGMNKVMDGMKLPKNLRIPYVPWNVKLATGGNVPGWSPNDSADNIPAWLTAGEFVTRRRSAKRMQKKHPGVLEYINDHGDLPAYARGGWAKPWPMAVGAYIKRMFPGTRGMGGYGARPGPSDHGTGNALDVMVPDSSPLGDAIANWAVANREALRLKYVIWKKKIIGSGKWGGWRPYTRYGNSKNRTLQHYDHPHLSFQHDTWGNPGVLAKGLSAEMLEQLKKGIGMLGDGMGFVNPFQSIMDTVTGKLKSFPGSDSLVGQMASGAAKSLIGAVPQFAMDRLGSFLGGGTGIDNPGAVPAGSAVERWRGTVEQALTRAGLPTSEAYVNAWLRQIKSESGGNPSIAQQIRDANGTGASAGLGLVQVIPGTFAAYRDKSLPNDRRNPLANLTAGMRYAKARYGARMLSVIGRGHGYAGGGFVKPKLYDTGGILSPGTTLVQNNTGKPETVRTYEQELELSRALAQQRGDVININGIKHDSIGEFAEGLNFALARRNNRRKYGRGH